MTIVPQKRKRSEDEPLKSDQLLAVQDQLVKLNEKVNRLIARDVTVQFKSRL
jgi:hypothetical protein